MKILKAIKEGKKKYDNLYVSGYLNHKRHNWILKDLRLSIKGNKLLKKASLSSIGGIKVLYYDRDIVLFKIYLSKGDVEHITIRNYWKDEDYYLNDMPNVLKAVFGGRIINEEYFNQHYKLFEE